MKTLVGGFKIKSCIALLGLIFLSGKLVAQSISITGVATTPVCAGSSVTVTFSTTNGNGNNNQFSNSTVYTIYLSNSLGASFTNQGTFSTSGTYVGGNGGVTSGITRAFVIPSSTATGIGYRIAIGSATPTFNGSAGAGASSAFTINASSTFSAQPGATVCANTDVIYTTLVGQTNYVWVVPGILNTDYSITTGGIGNASNTVTLKWLTAGSKTVSVSYNGLICPAISTTTVNLTAITHAATATSVCNTATQNALLTYSSTTGSPNQYSITWASGALTNVTNATLPTSPIVISVLSGTAVGTYTGNLTVRNSTTGCVSGTSTFTVAVFSGAPNTTGLTASVGSSCTNSGGVPVTVSSANLASGTYTVTYNLTLTGPSGSVTNQIAILAFTSGAPGTGTFTTVSHGATSATVRIVSISAGATCSSTINYDVPGSSTNNPLPSPSISITASTADIGNPNGSTISLRQKSIPVGTVYNVNYTLVGINGNTYPSTSGTASNVTMAAQAKGNTRLGTFVTGQLTTAGQYRITINSIAFALTGCSVATTATTTFSIQTGFFTQASGSWNTPSVWGGAGTGPNYLDGPITISPGHTITMPDTIAVGSTWSLDQLVIYGTLIIESGMTLIIVEGSGTDLSILNVVSPTSNGSVSVFGTLQFNGDVSHTGTTSTNVIFNAGSFYRHAATTTEGSPPNATWNATSTFSVVGYTTVTTPPNGVFASVNWSQNFGQFVWNCPSQAADINMNGLLGAGTSSPRVGAIQGGITVTSTGSGFMRLGNTTDFTLTVPGTFAVNGTSRFSNGPANGNGATVILNVNNFTYGSTASSWLCEAGQATVNVSGNIQINSGTVFLSDGGNNIDRSGTTINLTGNLTLVGGATTILSASSSNSARAGRLIFTNLPANTPHLYNTENGTISGWMIYQIAASQTVRAVNESHFFSTGTTAGGIFTMASTATLIVESTHANGAIQPDATPGTIPPAAGNVRIINAARNFASGSIIEYGRTTPAAQFINGVSHPISNGVNCIINNTAGVTVTSAGTVTIGGDLTVSAGNLTVAQSNVIVLLTTNTAGGNIVVNHRPTGGTTTFRFTGALNMTGGNVQCNSSTTDNGNNTELEINGDLTGSPSTFFAFSGNNCQVTVGGTAPTTFSRNFPISGTTTTLEQLRMNRVGATLVVSQPLTVGNQTGSTYSGGVFLNQGNLRMNSSLTVTTEVNLGNTSTTATDCLGSGILYFEGQTVELQRNIVTCYPNGVFSSNSSSVLNITSNFGGVADTIAFSPSGNILGTLMLNRTASVAPNVTLNTALAVANNFLITAGTFRAPSSANLTIQGAFTNNSTRPVTFDANGGTVIFNGTSTVSGSAVTNFNHITLNATRTLTFPALARVSGNLLFNAGSIFNHSNGNVEFNGAGAQLITPSNTVAAQVAKFYTITVNKSASTDVVTLDADLPLGHLLDMQQGILNSNDKLILLSLNETTDNDASIGPIGVNALITGNVIAQRFMAQKGLINRYISAPVLNTSVSELQDDFTITGWFTGTSFPCAGCDERNPNSLRWYNEEYLGNIANGYEKFPYGSNTEELVPGRGYLAFMWDNTVNPSWEVTGPVLKSGNGATDFSFPITKSGSLADPDLDNNNGWNLVGNPFPSAIVWNNGPGWIRAKIDQTIYVPDVSLNTGYPNYYHAWNLTDNTGSQYQTGALPGGIIAMGQAFWVRANGPGASLIARESVKTSVAGGRFYREKGENMPKSEQLVISINNGKFQDAAYFKLNPKANEGYDDFDAYKLKLKEMDIMIYFPDKDKRDLVMHTLSDINEGMRIPIGVEVKKPGVYNISFSNHENFRYGGSLYLIDALERQAVPVSSGAEYSVTISNSSKPITDRFYLSRTTEGMENEIVLFAYPNPTHEILNVKISRLHEIAQSELYDNSGRQLISTGEWKGESTIDMSGLSKGMYILKVKTAGGVVVKKIVKDE